MGYELPSLMDKVVNAAGAPTRSFGEKGVGPIKDQSKPVYQSIAVGKQGAVLLTKDKEMVSLGMLVVSFIDGSL